MWCLRVLRVQDNGRSNIQNPNPPSARRSRPCSRTSLQLTSKRHRAPHLGYLSYLGRQLLTPITHWMGRTCSRGKKGQVQDEGLGFGG